MFTFEHKIMVFADSVYSRRNRFRVVDLNWQRTDSTELTLEQIVAILHQFVENDSYYMHDVFISICFAFDHVFLI